MVSALSATDINAALDNALKQLNETTASKSDLVFLLSDGSPTSGITDLSKIRRSVLAKRPPDVSVHTLGFGDGADMAFLERLAWENKGIATKIYKDKDASVQMHQFYRLLSTPLLTHVQVKYPDDAVDRSSLTRVYFPNYVNGTEIVVAGKLSDDRSEALTARVDAESAQGPISLTLQVDEVGQDTMEDSRKGYLERIWAFQSVMALLKDMSLADVAYDHQQLKKQALNISLMYNFVIPGLTSMVVVEPDSSLQLSHDKGQTQMDQQKQSSIGKNNHGYSSPRSSSSSSSSSSSYSVDNDPHFIVNMTGSRRAICFSIDGVPGDVLQLVRDDKKGIYVNGKIIGVRRQRHHRKPRTYFGSIFVAVGDFHLVLTTTEIRTSNGMTLSWKQHTGLIHSNLHVSIGYRRNATISIGDGVKFIVLRHHRPNNKAAYMGFYIMQGKGFSKSTHGVLGQLYHRSVKIIKKKQRNESIPKLTRAWLYTEGHKVRVRKSKRRDEHLKKKVDCWAVKNNGRGLLHGKWQDYLQPCLTCFKKNKT
ncbi:PREDICTED: inter-alpha-trypsin inhibitor heavy chain H3-like [Priapulus caudatus]|uniref:Inter-alpha-trypsin inhibitor heavy chain H3-like n=1 Tax=Priapulus caudatus TaxID=37621 RepID=A0ABM1F4I1_PRICU|nr:PREDICTED: inter-alpha-trypsin inhibitor heavy chain H3-like [Priapulus caudatus]